MLASGIAQCQTAVFEAEDFHVYTEHPRLFLRPQRLRLLKRECQRQSIRWQQFDLLIAGKAKMPEPGFALALYYSASGNEAAGRQAVEWAAGASKPEDLRQLALVFDWCQPLLDRQKSAQLVAKLEQMLAKTESARDAPAVRARAMAAIVLRDHERATLPDAVLRLIVDQWWRREIVPALRAKGRAIPRDDVYPLFELMHVIRDNLNIDMREDAEGYFKELPEERLLSYYPAPFLTAENEYRVPVTPVAEEPQPRKAILARAADLAMVAYDNNAVSSQYLQGWAIQDRFLMRAPSGIPYEFLWANPYQPGLSFYKVPLAYHEPKSGTLFLRSSWEDDATWFGLFEGQMQLFEDGKVTALSAKTLKDPMAVGEATLMAARLPMRFLPGKDTTDHVFLLGLKPSQHYDVEVDDEEMREEEADGAGTLELILTSQRNAGVRLKDAGGR